MSGRAERANPKVVLFNGSDWIMGDTQITLKVAEAMVHQGFDVVFASVPGPALDEYRSRCPDAVTVTLPPPLTAARRAGRPWNLMVSVVAIFYTVARLRPDVVYTADRTVTSPISMLAAIVTFRRLILHVHQFGTFEQQWRYRLLGPRAAQVWLPSGFMKDKAATFGSDRCRVIFNAVEINPAELPSRSAALCALGIDDEQGSIAVALGRLSPFKGQATAVRAMATEEVRQSSIRLYIVGSDTGDGVFDDPPHPDYLSYLKALASELELEDRVRFLGPHPGVTALCAADMAILVSDDEPFGLTVLEAALCGTPVIAGSSGATPEIVTDERSALLVAPRDPELLASAMLRLAEDRGLRERLSAAAAENAAQFSIPRFRDRVASLIEELCPHWSDSNRIDCRP